MRIYHLCTPRGTVKVHRLSGVYMCTTYTYHQEIGHNETEGGQSLQVAKVARCTAGQCVFTGATSASALVSRDGGALRSRAGEPCPSFLYVL